MVLQKSDSIDKRRASLEGFLGTSLKKIGSYNSDLEKASSLNCENMIGSTQIPLGVAGPISINNLALDKTSEHFIPIATTEAALIASINRGCKAITQSGGAIVSVERVGITRSAVFYTKSLKFSTDFKFWLKENQNKIIEIAQKTSNHLKVLKIQVKNTTDLVFLNIFYDTDEAMGMNMATIATDAIATYIEQNTIYKCVSVAGNLDSDKKASFSSFVSGRGLQSWAEVLLNEEILVNILKSDATRIYETWYAKCVIGSRFAGSIGSNAHIANTLSGIFIATGQDPAHIVEGSMGMTNMRIIDQKNLYASVYLPSLILGVIGGGTKLPTQLEALEITRASGKNKITEFAGIVTAACLAGEISLLASLSEGSLAISHKRLGRSEK